MPAASEPPPEPVNGRLPGPAVVGVPGPVVGTVEPCPCSGVVVEVVEP